MLTLKLWNDWNKIRLHLARPELKLDGTNNASERSIGKSKVRCKSICAATREHGRDEKRHRAHPMALQRRRRARSEQGDGGLKDHQPLTEAVPRIRPPSVGQLL
jgi:hypothetical protein